MKYFFEFPDGEAAFTKEYFIEQMKDNGLTEMQVFPAKMITGESFAWCTKFNDAVETQAGDCGRWCTEYKPRNGKNGRCRFSNNCYEAVEIPITLYLKNQK